MKIKEKHNQSTDDHHQKAGEPSGEKEPTKSSKVSNMAAYDYPAICIYEWYGSVFINVSSHYVKPSLKYLVPLIVYNSS